MLFAEEVARQLSKRINLSVSDIIGLLEVPPDTSLGDLAFPCFTLAKEFKKSPAQIAMDLAQQVKPELPVDIFVATGPYLNVYLNKSLLAEQTLKSKVSFPRRKSRVMVEHSNGNTHKAVHIGHLRNLFLGDSLVRILKAANFPVVNSYYINDTGAMVARCLWALEKFHQGEEAPASKLAWLGSIYAQGVAALKEDKSIKKEMDELLQKLESGDPHVTKIWKETRQWSLDDWHRIFEQLQMLPFDARFYDSEVVKDVKPIVDDLRKKGIVKESEGAFIVTFEEESLGVVIIRKSDGTTPYIAKDLALAAKKFKDYEIDKSVYVVASEQELHFQQLFKILEMDGFKQAKKCYHLSYGLVMLSSGKLSSREGTALLFDDFYTELYDHALAEVKKRHEDWSEKKLKDAAKNIALAAMKLPMVMQEPNKRIIFDIRKSLDFEGETGPYAQYSYARISSILRKYGKKVSSNIDYGVLVSAEEQAIIKLLAGYQDVVIDAAEKYKPHLVARYAIELSQAINSFYHSTPILKEAETVKKARLFLVAQARDYLGKTLELLGIPILEEM